MRKDFGAKLYTYPQPVSILATYGEDGVPDAAHRLGEKVGKGAKLK